jgi:hypothetical protein
LPTPFTLAFASILSDLSTDRNNYHARPSKEVDATLPSYTLRLTRNHRCRLLYDPPTPIVTTSSSPNLDFRPNLTLRRTIDVSAPSLSCRCRTRPSRSRPSGSTAMASSSFRDSINSLGWSRRDEPVNTSQQSGLLSSIQSLNPFQGGSGYVRLPTTENAGAPLPAPSRREEEEGWFVRKSTLKCYLMFTYGISVPLQRDRCIASEPCPEYACDTK